MNATLNGKYGAFAAAGEDCLQGGLTKREYAAIAALQGIIAADKGGELTAKQGAEWAVQYADALLEALGDG